MKSTFALLAVASFGLCAATLRAQEPAWEVFAMPRDARGAAGSVATLTPEDAQAVYVDALRAMPAVAMCLKGSLLSHAQGYADFMRGDTATLSHVAKLVSLRFPCLPSDPDRSPATFTVSQIYRVDSASVRVFVFYSSPGPDFAFAAEDVFLIRKEAGTWRVVARRNVMIT